jgi:hypothetical protein
MTIQILPVKEVVSNVTTVKVMYVIADSLFAHAVYQNPPLCKLIDIPLELIDLGILQLFMLDQNLHSL